MRINTFTMAGVATVRTILACMLGLVVGALGNELRSRDRPDLVENQTLVGERFNSAGRGLRVSDATLDKERFTLASDTFATQDTCTWLRGAVTLTTEASGSGDRAAVQAREAVHESSIGATAFSGDVTFSGPESDRGFADVLITTTDGSYAARAHPAVVSHGGMKLSSDLISYDASTQAVRARRGAHASFAVADHPLGADCEAWILSKQARVEESGAWWFSGKAAAWCGSSVLTAGVIHGDPETVRATGDVRLSLRDLDGANVIVRAERMVRATSGEAVFSGRVQVTGSAGELECDDFRVELFEGKVTAVECSGESVGATGQEGRISDATWYRHDLARQLVTVVGNPARIERADGSWLSGALLESNLETGAVRASGRHGSFELTSVENEKERHSV